jgi:two-component system nitrogen regulation response regulator NtrX
MQRPLIFIIDDEEDLVSLIAKRIRNQGYDVQSYLEGEKALQAFQESKPDVVLLDIWLPDISGIDIFKKLKENERTRDIPVLFFSADLAQEEFCVKVLGARGFIMKPYNTKKLIETISQIVGVGHPVAAEGSSAGAKSISISS